MLLKEGVALQGLKSTKHIDFDRICLKSIALAFKVILFHNWLSIKIFFLVSNKTKTKINGKD